MKTTIKIKKILLALFVVFMMAGYVTPITTYAATNTSTSKMDFNFTMSNNGELAVSGADIASDNSANAWNRLFAKYKTFIVGVSGVGAITMIVLFIIQFMKLGASAGNPQARTQALTGVLWTGLAATGLGAVTVVVGFFYNAL